MPELESDNKVSTLNTAILWRKNSVLRDNQGLWKTIPPVYETRNERMIVGSIQIDEYLFSKITPSVSTIVEQESFGRIDIYLTWSRQEYGIIRHFSKEKKLCMNK